MTSFHVVDNYVLIFELISSIYLAFACA